MTPPRDSEWPVGHVRFVGFLALVFLSRVPFLSPGYGSDADAWRLANAARCIGETRTYCASRTPGYPLPEIAYSLVYSGGPVLANAITAVLSVAAAGLFVCILRERGVRRALLGGLALAFTPSVYISSTSSMDYVWALAFMLGSLYAILRNRIAVAAAVFGLAVASRPTSLIAGLPLCLLVCCWRGRPHIRSVLLFFVVSITTSALFFLPVVMTYGKEILTFYDQSRPLVWVLYAASVSVWGTIGSIALFTLVGLRTWHLRYSVRTYVSKATHEELLFHASCLLCVVLYVIAFLRLPHEGGYLIPAVPFILLLAERLLRGKHFALLCVLIVVSSFLVSLDNTGLRPEGPIIDDHRIRSDKMACVQSILSVITQLDHKAVIITGSWLPQLQALAPDDDDELVNYMYLATEQELRSYLDSGVRAYYLDGQRERTLFEYGYDLEGAGAVLISCEGALHPTESRTKASGIPGSWQASHSLVTCVSS